MRGFVPFPSYGGHLEGSDEIVDQIGAMTCLLNNFGYLSARDIANVNSSIQLRDNFTN